MINVIAVDDEPIALDIIKSHADKIPFIDLQATFVSAAQALAYIGREPVDLVFLDISMPDLSGLEFAELVKHKAQVIFTTAHPEHALKGFELAVTDYLLKPVTFSRFLQACQLAQTRISTLQSGNIEQESLFVKDGHNWVQIKHSNILYVQGQDNYAGIAESDKTTLTRTTLTQLESKLPQDQFLRIHKSYIISLSKIEKIEKHQVTIGKTRIPLSKLFRDVLLQRLNK